METFSALLVLCAGNSSLTGVFPSQRPVTRNIDVFFDLHLNKRLSKQSWVWWFKTPSSSLWCHCNEACRWPSTLARNGARPSAGPLLNEESYMFTCKTLCSSMDLYLHYSDVIMSVMMSQITGVSIVCSTVDSDADQRKHQSSASLAFVRGIHRWRGIPHTNGR